MSSEEEFIRWLNRPEKTFEENFSFALKAWKSSEFLLFTKYEKVLEWLGENVKLLGTTTAEFQDDLVNEFLQLRCQPGLINLPVKSAFLQRMLKWAKKWKDPSHRKPVEVLFRLSEQEIMQDLLRKEYEVYAKILGQLFTSYIKYLRSFEGILVGAETEFFSKIMETVRSRAAKAGDLKEFEAKFTEFAVQPLVELIIVFGDKGIKFFDDFLQLEKTLFTEYKNSDLMGRFLALPTHVNLVKFECAIVNYRGDTSFLKSLVQVIFGNLLKGEMAKDPALSLTLAAYILEMFRKHDIVLSFPATKTQNALQFFGEKISSYVATFKDDHLLEVLNLLCATLRLNPLILEKSVFEITTQLMIAKKSDEEQQVFEEYLILLMDMFRKLSRAEKFVASLQKSIRELLNTCTIPKKGKRKRKTTEPQEETEGKKPKLIESMSTPKEDNFYLQVLFKDFHQTPKIGESSTKVVKSFNQVAFAWPSDSVGVSFSKMIVGLMSKPSLTIWKTSIYALKELIQSTTELDENTLFLFDFYSSLVCQYFRGCKLPEQSDKFWQEIEANRKLTRETLHEFGHFLLGHEHNKQTMNAFLECCYHARLFDLLLWYYRPDFMTNDEEFETSSANLHGYLSPDEWVLIQQRIINFGRVDCKFNANRLLLQQLKAKMLFRHKTSVRLQEITLTADFEQTKLIFSSATSSSWLLSRMSSKEKQEICEIIVQELDYEVIANLVEDIECLEMITLSLYKQMALVFQESKKAILSGIDFEWDAEQIAKAVVDKKDGYGVKKLEVEDAKKVLDVMQKLPIGWCKKDKKELIFALQLALYRDLKAAGQDELAQSAYEIMIDLLHFGQQIQVFKHFPIDRIVVILPPSPAKEFYEFIFSTLKHDIDIAEKFLETVEKVLKENEDRLSNDHVKLLLMSIVSLTQGTTHKRLKRFLNSLLAVYVSHITAFLDGTREINSRKDEKFVKKTLPGFVPHAKMVLNVCKSEEQLDESFRRICKIYIAYSMDYHNPYAIQLITLALANRTNLHFDQDEIEFVLNGYWVQLIEDLKTGGLDEKTASPVIRLIINNKSNEDLLFTLKKIGKDIAREDFGYICRLLALIANCPFSTVKGAIFNEHFKVITLDMILRLGKDEHCQFTDYETVLSLLQCQKAITENSKISISYDTLDDILAFLMDINIKKFPIGDTNVQQFKQLHQAMSEVCTVMIRSRHLILLDRVPQFVNIFKDLLQAICWYKSDRQKDTPLSSEELDDLAELALKMESLMHLIASHSLEVKRVAPFVLTFVINLMMASKRPTTLYPKIKTHIENICYDLVAVCDHRVGQFILRCSNEAARQVYEVLVKDHKKYHKFKGKV